MAQRIEYGVSAASWVTAKTMGEYIFELASRMNVIRARMNAGGEI
jgi:hypothetical protein